MVRFYFEKLVRDNIVQNCLDDPLVITTNYEVLSDDDYRRELIKKLAEEVAEIPVDDADPAEFIEEISDLQMVIDTLLQHAGISKEELAAAMGQKTLTKGAFDKRHYISYVDVAEDSGWVEVFRKQPHKYREITLEGE